MCSGQSDSAVSMQEIMMALENGDNMWYLVYTSTCSSAFPFGENVLPLVHGGNAVDLSVSADWVSSSRGHLRNSDTSCHKVTEQKCKKSKWQQIL